MWISYRCSESGAESMRLAAQDFKYDRSWFIFHLYYLLIIWPWAVTNIICKMNCTNESYLGGLLRNCDSVCEMLCIEPSTERYPMNGQLLFGLFLLVQYYILFQVLSNFILFKCLNNLEKKVETNGRVFKAIGTFSCWNGP